MGPQLALLALILADHVLTVGMFDEGLKHWSDYELRSNMGNMTMGNDSASTNSTNDWLHPIIGDSGFRIAITVFVVILAMMIVISNGAMIVCFVASAKVRHILRVFVFNLCLVDLQNGCIALPLLVIYPRGTDRDWMADVSGLSCIFISFWPTSLAITAFLSIVLVTADRFVAIVFPLHFHKIASTRHCILVVIFIWIYAILFSFAPAYAIEGGEVGEKYIVGCNGLYVYSSLYMDYLLFAILCVPLVAVVAMYLVMYHIARRHRRAIDALTILPDDRTLVVQKHTLVRNSKAAKTTFIMTAAFVVCWFPFLVIMLLSDLCSFDTCPGGVDRSEMQLARVITACLAFLNSAVNPWIYGFRNAAIRAELRGVFCRRQHSTPVLPIIADPATTTGNLSASTRSKASKNY